MNDAKVASADLDSDRPAPIVASERIESIDVLRGVAVLGIFALNIQSFSMPSVAYMNPTAYGDLSGINYWTWYVVHLFGDMKFWTIFSMLFGAGIVIMTTRCETTGRRALGIHYRRMGWLVLFGLLHAHLLWYGDILYTYGMCGLLLYFFRKLKPRTLLILSIFPLLISFMISLGFGALMGLEEAVEMRQELAKSWAPDEALIQQELDIYRGSWLKQLPHRAGAALMFETFLFAINFGWRSAGLMLIGMALFKLDVFSAARSTRFYVTLVAIALLIGIPLAAFGVYQNESHDWAIEYSFFFGPLYNYWASILVALGWISAVMLVCKSESLHALTRPFAAAGRMALSCYLIQTIVATTFFYGHGFGWFGHLERWQAMAFVMLIWACQLVFAMVWLKYFRYGPFEWLWRTLTYLKLQPMRKNSAPQSSS